MIRFTKMHGAGNDFVVIDACAGAVSMTPELAARIADRHRGVGCDQIMLIEHRQRYGYRIFNADGTSAAQCGNGARCVARYLHERFGVIGEAIDSPSGPITPQHRGGERYTISLPAPRFALHEIPFDAERESVDYAIDVAGETLRIAALSMGNPHAVLRVDHLAGDIDRLGAALSNHPRFPDRVNVGFVQVLSRDAIRLRVFERGVGETLACGSGACAAAIASMRWGNVDSSVFVHLPGGVLEVAWHGGEVELTGPAAFVFEGEFLS